MRTERDETAKAYFEEIIDDFASIKARKVLNFQKVYLLHSLAFVKIVPTSNLQIIRKGAHLNFAMGATLHRYASGDKILIYVESV